MSVNNVSGAQPQKPVIPAELQAQLEKAKPEERQGIFAKFLQENASNTEVFNNVLSFMKEEAKAEVQQARADQHQRDIAEMEAAKEASKQEQRKADLESGDKTKVAEATVAQAQDNLAEATRLADENPNDVKMQEQKANAEKELAQAQQNYKELTNNDGGRLGITRARGEQVVQDASGDVSTRKIDDAYVNYNLSVPTSAGEKWSKDDARAVLNKFTNNTGHDFVVKDKDGNEFTITQGQTVEGDQLKALKKQIDAEYKEAEKAAKKMPTEENTARAQKLYEERAMIRAAESGKGIGRATSTHNKNVKAIQNLIDTQVFYTEADKRGHEQAAKARGEEIRATLVEPRDLNVIGHLVAKAKDKIANAPEGERASTEALWGELANMCEVDKNGNVVGEYPDPEKVKNALIDITGGGAQLSISEMKIVAEATGCSDGDVRHAFRAYGFEAERPIGKKILNGLKAAAPAAVMTLASLLFANKKTAKADAHSRAENTVNFHAEDTQTVTGHNTTTTITNNVTPGTTTYTVDPNTGEILTHQTAGSTTTSSTTTDSPFDVTAHASVSGSVTAVAESAVSVVATAVAKGAPLAGAALTAYEFIKGLVKTPYEKGVVNGADMYKVTHFTELVKGDDNKKIASQIQQMVGGLTGDRDMDAKIITAVLDQENGSQNSILDKRELEMALQDLLEIQRNFQKVQPAKITEIEKPEPAPTTDPTPNTNPDPVVEDKYYATRTEELDKRIPWNGLNQSPHYVATMYKFIGPDGQEYNMLSGSELNRKNHALYQDFANHVYGRAEDDNVNKDIENKNTYLYPKVMNLGNGWKAVLVTDNMKLDSGVNKPRRKGKGKGKAPQATKSKMRTGTVGSGSTQDGVDNTEGQNYRSRNASDVDNHFQDQGRKKSSKTLSGDK